MNTLRLRWSYRDLKFIQAAKTSRDTLYTKPSWFIELEDSSTGKKGIGECSLIPGLNPESAESVSAQLRFLEGDVERSQLMPDLYKHMPALRFGLETALRSLEANDPFVVYESDFTKSKEGIPINGLIWMASPDEMLQQMHDRVAEGFTILKMKVGAFDLDKEFKFLSDVRRHFPADRFELRLDANGAFAPEDALAILQELDQLGIHSIEQPIKPKQWDTLAHLCAESPIPIALDEELIGCEQHAALLDRVQPQYLILKPSLIGGLSAAQKWADAAEARNIGWWATSALESNIGLNAIAQWCAVSGNPLPQGLGTGRLFSNNVPSPLLVADARLHYTQQTWNTTELFDV
jgi:o-succinylbenzoate synthase